MAVTTRSSSGSIITFADRTSKSFTIASLPLFSYSSYLVVYAISEHAQTLVPKPPLPESVAFRDRKRGQNWTITFSTIFSEILARSFASFPSQLADRHTNVQFMRLFVIKIYRFLVPQLLWQNHKKAHVNSLSWLWVSNVMEQSWQNHVICCDVYPNGGMGRVTTSISSSKCLWSKRIISK